MEKDRTARGGYAMSSIEKWLKEERSLKISGGSILYSLFAIGLILAFSMWLCLRSYKSDTIYFNGSPYYLEGLAKMADGGKIFYVPVYKEVK